MNTTVKDFIINNITDDYFERLVHRLIVDEIFNFCRDNTIITDIPGVIDVADIAALDLQQSRSFKGQNTFTILNTIKNLKKDDLNLTSSFVKNFTDPFLIKVLEMEMNKELDLEMNLDSLYWMDIEMELDMDASSVTFKNYKYFILQELRNKANNLVQFLYEILHSQPGESQTHTSEIFKEWLKLQPNPDTIRQSLVEITNQTEQSSDYCVRILVDNRTRYLPAHAHNFYYSCFEMYYPVTPIKFAEFEALYEDLDCFWEYLLEPFTHYLNEPITIPSVQEDVIYSLLEQLILLLTAQGFTEEIQLDAVQFRNENFDRHI